MDLHRTATIAALAVLALPGLARAEPCAPATAPPPVETVRAFYAAAMAGDKAGIVATFGPDFHAFDQGKRYSASEFAGIVDFLRANHLTMAWTVNEPHQTVSCDIAWVDWANRGSVTDVHGTKPLAWLESAVLRWQDGAWKMAFFHSTPVSP